MKKSSLSLILLLFIILPILANPSEEIPKEQDPSSTYLSILLNKVKLSGYAQTGYTYNSSELKKNEREGKSSNTFDIKRIIFIAEAEVVKDLTFCFMYDFGGNRLHEIWGEYKFNEAFKLKIGQYKTPYTIENPISSAALEIISGAQSVQYLAGITNADVCYGGKAGRDLGIMLHGDFLSYQSWKLFSYKAGVFNGQGINTKDLNNHKDIVGTLMINPLKAISVGGSFYLGTGHSQSDNPFSAFKEGDNYTRNRWSAGTEITTKPLYIRAEYLQGKDGSIKSEGYYAVANWHILPKLDIIASYDYFSPNKDANKDEYDIVTKQTNYIIGTQWNFYRRCRLQVQYIFQDRGKGWDNANLLMAQFQIGF